MAVPSLVLLQGDPTTWAVPPAGKTNIGVSPTGVLTLQQSGGTITPLVSTAPGFHVQASSSGEIDISAPEIQHTEVVTISGSARAIPIVLYVGAVAGAVLNVSLKLPLTANLAITFYNLTNTGTVLIQYTTDGSIAQASMTFVFDGTNWNLLSANIPAT